MDYIEEIAEESEENPESIEKLYNDLSYLSENPLNLNRITAEQLKQIPFLSDIQILNILDYLKKQGEFVSIYELKNIRFLDVETIELILPFIYVGEIDKTRPFTIKNLLKFGTNEFLLRYDRCLNEKKGYKELPDSILQQYPNRKYVGEPFYTSLRYSYSFDNRLQVGVVAEKDAGEAFWNSYNKGYDFYSVHALLKDLGTIRTLAIGDYKISFGQGLVISNDFTPSRSSILSQAERRNNGFRRHYSTNENDFFRGVASTLSVGKFDVSAFYSNRKADATADEYTISSFKTDGLHRTEGDLEKKRNIRIETIGGNIRYVSPRFLIGVTALTYSFGGLSVEPELKPYNIFYFRGKRNTNIGMDYTWRHRQLVFFGETALSENSALATLNAFQWSASSGLKAIILHRHYDRKYQAFCGNAFSQNSTVQNEDGLYISMQWAPFAYWRFSGYADFFRFPWIKYGIDAPSSGQEYMIQTDFNRIRNTTISARYRFRQREKNVTGENEVMILPADQHRVRLQITHKPSGIMIFRTSIEGNIYDDNKSSSNRGWVISQSIGWKKTNSPVQADMYAAYFHTDDYNSRVYSNEKNMLYSFYIPSFYGEGIRLSTVLRYNFTKKLYVSVKAAWAHYYDREIISSGLEEIEGRDKIDLYAQLRWKF
jgi:sRNA-binding carbon storage regulator CsrA